MSFPTPTRISKIYDHILAQCALSLKEHQELEEPNDLFENAPERLQRGYGINIGPGRNTNRCIDTTRYYHERDFTILIVRDSVALDSDKETRKLKWKSLLEDLHLVLKNLSRNTTIVNGTEVIAFKLAYVDDSGPRDTVIKGQAYNFIELTVTVEYHELTSGG